MSIVHTSQIIHSNFQVSKQPSGGGSKSIVIPTASFSLDLYAKKDAETLPISKHRKNIVTPAKIMIHLSLTKETEELVYTEQKIDILINISEMVTIFSFVVEYIRERKKKDFTYNN